MDKLDKFLQYLKSLIELIFTYLIHLIKYSYNNPTEACVIIIVIIIVIFIAGYLLYKTLMNVLSRIDERIDYSNKNFKYSREVDTQTNKTYYVFNYWKWQKNKLRHLQRLYKIGTELINKHTITDTGIYETRTNNIFSKNFYKKEYRIYTEFINHPSNYYGGDYIKGNKITNSGIQVNNIQNQLSDSILKQILQLTKNENIKQEDRDEIKTSLKKIENKLYSKQDNNKLINILSNYIGISANIVTIIEYLSKL